MSHESIMAHLNAGKKPTSVARQKIAKQCLLSQLITQHNTANSLSAASAVTIHKMGAPSLQQDQQSPSAADENEIDDKVETAKQAASSASAGGVAETLSGNHGQGDIGDGLVESYTSLIQQYLSVMCLDNAIFLAERLVATEKSSYSLYLLALCHHRSGQPRSALSVLEQTTTTSSSIYYLTAVCCYELEEYGRAEEALLHQCRLDFRQQRSNTISVTEPLSKASERMEQWIVTTTVRTNK